MNKIESKEFFEVWVQKVTIRKEELLEKWRKYSEYTSCIKGTSNSIIGQIASELNLKSYEKDYYSLDALLYKEEDKTPRINTDSFWFHNIRVAFEHENNFKSGLYQEVSHLLLINSELKVLVAYPNEDPKNELEYIHQIITANIHSDVISETKSFLIIFGYEEGFKWEGYVYEKEMKNEWKPIW